MIMMNKTQIKSRSETETADFASLLAQSARQGDVFCLVGPLGAGKTAFAKGFAKGLGVPKKEYVTSPTFTLINEYHGGKLPMYHFDAYRLSSAEELEGIGYEEYMYSNGVCLIEWADKVEDIMPPDAVWIEMAYTGSDNERLIQMRGREVEWSLQCNG